VALGSYGAGLLAVDAGADITLVRPDGSTVDRRVAAVFERDLGFGQVVMPIDDLRPATDSGRATGVSIELAPGASPRQAAGAVAALLRDRPGLSVGTSPVVADAEVAGGEGSLRLLLLTVLAGYIAIAVANSVVVTTLARRREFSLLGVIGATPHQLRRMARVEGLFLAAAASVIGTVVAVPGLVTMTAALSHGATSVPSIEPAWYAGIVAITFGLALGATAASTRLTMRGAGSGPSRPAGRGDAGR
jgi:putative ABC transport system permease protein